MPRHKKGMMLIVSYLVIMVLIILGSAFITQSFTERRVAEKEKNRIQAFYLAESGIATACDGLRQNWEGFTSGLPRTRVFTQNFDYGGFSVDIESGPLADTVRLISTGTTQTTERIIEEVVRGTVGEGMEGYDFALLACGNLFLEGNASIENQDVYVNGNMEIRSVNGITGGNAYAKGTATLANGGSVTGSINANKNITVNTGSIIDGDAASKRTVTNNGTITGTTTSGAVPDPVDEAALQAKADSYRLSEDDWTNYETQARSEGNYHEGNFSPSGSYTGTHYVNGNVIVGSDFSGTATFVITGNVEFQGGTADLSPGGGNDYSFIVGGNFQSTAEATGMLGGVIYCEGNFRLSTAITFAGAVICYGNLYGSSDFCISFPTAETTLEVLSWREL